MLDFYYLSGSPYAWRVWLALEHKRVPYDFKLLSFSAGDFAKPEFAALNPRRRVPVINDDGFALYESAAILEYLEDRYAGSGGDLLPRDVKQRAIARRMVREADQYAATAMEGMVEQILFKEEQSQWDLAAIAKHRGDFVRELATFERYFSGDAFLVRAVGAADFTLYPLIALALRLERWKPDLGIAAGLGPKLSAWMRRMEALPYFLQTYPPHWKQDKA
jgi:glutathione S-transferase